MENIIALHNTSIVGTYVNRSLALTEGEGVWLKDPAGRKYLDLMTNYGVNIFGHGHPTILKALTAQMGRLTTLHGSFANDVRAEAAGALAARCGGGLSRIQFSNSGSEANEAALKFAVLATGRKRFLRCRSGYHGKTLGALSATDSPKFRAAFEPLLWDFVEIPFDDLDAVESALDDRTAGLIAEPIQGEGGVRPASAGYLKGAADLCAACGALLILDEVQTGMGRTGTFLASSPEVLSYDIVTMGKGLAGGIPVGATIVSPAVAERIPKSSHTSTFGGNPLAAAGVLATLPLIDDALLAHVRDTGARFSASLRSACLETAAEITGRGLMIGVRVRSGRDLILKELQRQGILACPAAGDVVRFLPPFIIQGQDLDSAMGRIVGAFMASGA
jgi:LysW-gamma-L-lysine/LysW-L-ornithine aminotransferase